MTGAAGVPDHAVFSQGRGLLRLDALGPGPVQGDGHGASPLALGSVQLGLAWPQGHGRARLRSPPVGSPSYLKLQSSRTQQSGLLPVDAWNACPTSIVPALV